MATQPITGSAIAVFPATPPLVAVAQILGRFDRPTLEAFMTVAVAMLDLADGDPDFENATDLEDDHALSPFAMGFDRGRGPGDETSDTGEDDDIETGIEDDPRGCDPECDAGEEEFGEIEQMLDDVPMLPVVTLEPNIFTDQRQSLGIGNLQSSFQARGEGVMSADTGAMHVSSGESWPRTPGVPV